MTGQLIFLLGGARSGKSHYAENWARQHGQRVLYVATAQALDDEMRDRISHHRAQRPPQWETLEAPLHVGGKIAHTVTDHDTIVLDCITLLVTNVLMTLPEEVGRGDYQQEVLAEVDALLAAYTQSSATWLIVSNEVGMGIVPPTHYGRIFRDVLGHANQRIAQQADDVLLMVAGLPWRLKPV